MHALLEKWQARLDAQYEDGAREEFVVDLMEEFVRDLQAMGYPPPVDAVDPSVANLGTPSTRDKSSR